MLSSQEEEALQEWTESGKYLPEFMRDFHDQKDLFKTIHWLTRPGPEKENLGPGAEVSWLVGHIYVTDKFLWVMAKFGWTLQRTRSKSLRFRDYDELNQARRAEEWESFRTVAGLTLSKRGE